MIKRTPLNPSIKSIRTEHGHRYEQCKAIVELEINSGKDGKTDIIVEYPLQSDLHLTALMMELTENGGKKDIPHYDKMELSKAILKSINPKGI